MPRKQREGYRVKVKKADAIQGRGTASAANNGISASTLSPQFSKFFSNFGDSRFRTARQSAACVCSYMAEDRLFPSLLSFWNSNESCLSDKRHFTVAGWGSEN